MTKVIENETRNRRVTHAGGVVVRQSEKSRQYLLVRATKSPSEWVLPKGHVEGGETMADCAIREVREETGVLARITHDLGTVDYVVEDKPIRVQFYLMQPIKQDKPDEPLRNPSWFPLEGDDGAMTRVNHQESRTVLSMAEAKLNNVIA